MKTWSSTCCATTQAVCKEDEERGLGSLLRAQEQGPILKETPPRSSVPPLQGQCVFIRASPANRSSPGKILCSAVGILPWEGTYQLPTIGCYLFLTAAAAPATTVPSDPGFFWFSALFPQQVSLMPARLALSSLGCLFPAPNCCQAPAAVPQPRVAVLLRLLSGFCHLRCLLPKLNVQQHTHLMNQRKSRLGLTI